MLRVKHVSQADIEAYCRIDRHVGQEYGVLLEELGHIVQMKRCYLIELDDEAIGVMRYGLFWDSIPFLNLIYFGESKRGLGYGSVAMRVWEDEMRELGYPMVMLSTQVDEDAQHFYRKLGYQDCGGLVMNIPPFEQPMEMFLMKRL